MKIIPNSHLPPTIQDQEKRNVINALLTQIGDRTMVSRAGNALEMNCTALWVMNWQRYRGYKPPTRQTVH